MKVRLFVKNIMFIPSKKTAKGGTENPLALKTISSFKAALKFNKKKAEKK